MLVHKTDEGIIGINRRGLRVALPEPIAAGAERLPGSFLFDGEAVGDTLHVFDLRERDGVCQRSRSLIDRLTELEDLFRDHDRSAIVPFPPAIRETDKRAFWAILGRRNAEGVVFKACDSTHRPGRPAAGGDWLKFKVVETTSFLVTAATRPNGAWRYSSLLRMAPASPPATSRSPPTIRCRSRTGRIDRFEWERTWSLGETPLVS